MESAQPGKPESSAQPGSSVQPDWMPRRPHSTAVPRAIERISPLPKSRMFNASPARHGARPPPSISSHVSGEMAEVSQNSISALLDRPIIKTGLSVSSQTSTSSRYRAPTSRDIPPVALVDAPKIDSSLFNPYLTLVTPLYDAIERNYSALQNAAADGANGGETKAPEDAGSAFNVTITSPTSDLGQDDFPETTPLSVIPEIYFESQFRLENPRIFDVVTENSELISDYPEAAQGESLKAERGTERKYLATNAILQERLSWYIETVEIHLTAAISSASTSFFEALDSLRNLQKEAEDSVLLIDKLRNELKILDSEMAVGGMELISLERKRRNIDKLAASLEQLGNTTAGITHCRLLVESKNYEEALDKIDMLEAYISGQFTSREPSEISWLVSDPDREVFDLRGLQVLSSVFTEISKTRSSIGKAFELRFIDILIADIRSHISTLSYDDVLERWKLAAERSRGILTPSGTTSPPSYFVTDKAFYNDLSSCLRGLNRSGQSSSAAVAFREAIMREMKVVIRQQLPSSSDDDAVSIISSSTRSGHHSSRQEKSSTLSRNLSALDEESAEEMVFKTYVAVGEALRRLGTQIKVILDVTTGISAKSPPESRLQPNNAAPQASQQSPFKTRGRSNSATLREELVGILDISSLTGQAVDVALYYIHRVLKARNEQTVSLPIDYFLRYISLNRLFLHECEAVSGRSGTSVAEIVTAQINEFIDRYTDKERMELQQVLDLDRWQAIQILPELLDSTTRILQSAEDDPPEWGIFFDINLKKPLETPNEKTTAKEEGAESQKHLYIGEDQYTLVESTSQAIYAVERYLKLLYNLPSVGQDLCLCMLDYLRLFNSRTCQLILGAGATRSAGLASINTRHLALAYLSLSFLVRLMDSIRMFASRRIPVGSNFSAELDKTKSLYYEHLGSLEEKLIDIMTTRSAMHVLTMESISFDSPDVAGQDVSEHMVTLTKETNTLHRVLNRHLPAAVVERIMEAVFGNYQQQWGQAFGSAIARTATADGRDRLARDARLFEHKLGKIEEARELVDWVVGLVDSQSGQGREGAQQVSGLRDNQQQQQQQKREPTPIPTPEQPEQPETQPEESRQSPPASFSTLAKTSSDSLQVPVLNVQDAALDVSLPPTNPAGSQRSPTEANDNQSRDKEEDKVN